MKPTRAQIRFLNECSTPIPETSEQASKLITAMLDNPTIPAQTTASLNHAKKQAKLKSAAHELLIALRVVMDCVDYTNSACRPNEQIGAVLPKSAIDQAKAAIKSATS